MKCKKCGKEMRYNGYILNNYAPDYLIYRCDECSYSTSIEGEKKTCKDCVSYIAFNGETPFLCGTYRKEFNHLDSICNNFKEK